MGSYNLDSEEIADILETSEIEHKFEGDFYEETFIEGCKIYLDRLRENGAFVYSSIADKKKLMCKGCGKAKKNGKCIICQKKKKEVIDNLK